MVSNKNTTFDTAYVSINGTDKLTTVIYRFILNVPSIEITVHISINKEKSTPENNPKTINITRFFISSCRMKGIPAIKPMIPHENIWNGVQGPWPKYIFDNNAVKAPTRKPASAPKEIADKITIAVTGLNPGIAANKKRPTTDKAIITANITIRLIFVSLFSNERKKGVNVNKTITKEINT